jgi:hypothetical protein
MTPVLAFSPIQVTQTKRGPQIVLPHPNPKSPVALVVDALGFRCRSEAGDRVLDLAAFARHLAEWHRDCAGVISGRSNSPEVFARTGIADIITINRPGRLEHLLITTQSVLLLQPNPDPTGEIYLTTRLHPGAAELARVLAEWFGDKVIHPTLKGD